MLKFVVATLIAISPQHALAQTGSLFDKYNIMVTPKADVPVGARWIPGVGPSGVGANDNVSISAGSAASTINSTTKKQMSLSVAQFFGFSGNSSQSIKVNLESLEIHRVIDLTKLEIKPGEQVLYEAIKAKKIIIKADDANAAQVKANATARGIPINADASVSGDSAITLDGSNLFLAYQVVQLKLGKLSTVRKSHEGEELTISGTYRFQFCQCLPNDGVRVIVTNLLAPNADGTFNKSVYVMKDQRGGWLDIPLAGRLVGNKLISAIATVKYGSFFPMKGVTVAATGEPLRFEDFNSKFNNVTIRSITSEIEPVSKPQGIY
jgi:hypothetical protein